jgi:hemerythrin superfamily protein
MVETRQEQSIPISGWLPSSMLPSVKETGGSVSDPGTDGINLIIRDHQKVMSLINKEYKNATLANKRNIMRQIIKELCIHAQIEEHLVYPLLLKICGDGLHDEGEKSMNGSIADHQELEELLDKLLDDDLDDESYTQTAKQMIRDLSCHIQMEETEILPKLRNAMSREQLELLTMLINEGKEIAPDKPYMTEDEWWKLEPIASLYQKLKDSFT